MRVTRLVLIIISLAALVLIVVFPDVCISSALTALNMWFSLVVPAMLPFFIGAGILMETGAVKLIGAFFDPLTRFFFSLPGESAYVFIASAISGYPMGAKICAEMYREKKMDLETAQRTVCFTSIGGPLFILGTVAFGMLGFQPAGAYIAAAHYMGAVTAGLLTGFFYKKRVFVKTGYIAGIRGTFASFKAESANRKSVGDVLEQAVTRGVMTMLLIGGTMVLFNVLAGILQKVGAVRFLCDAFLGLGIPEAITQPVINGVLEMTNGCRLAAASGLSLAVKIPLIALIISFGGLSVHAQTFAIAARSGLKLKYFITAKVIQALASFFAAFMLLQAFPLSAPVFSETGAQFSGHVYAYIGSGFAAASFILLLATSLFRRKKRACLSSVPPG